MSRKLLLSAPLLFASVLGACASSKGPAPQVRWVTREELARCTQLGLLDLQPGDEAVRALPARAAALGGNAMITAPASARNAHVEVWSCPVLVAPDEPGD